MILHMNMGWMGLICEYETILIFRVEYLSHTHTHTRGIEFTLLNDNII